MKPVQTPKTVFQLQDEVTDLRNEVSTYERITDKLAETNVALTLENTTLREAVRLLGEDARQSAEALNGNEDNGKWYEWISEAVWNNPIAAAAVRGEVKHGN